MAQITIRLVEPTAAVASTAARIAAEYATNRGKQTAWRVAPTIAAAITAANGAAGTAVELTAYYPYEGGTSPAYNIVHRAIGIAPIREIKARGNRKDRSLWSCIKTLALKDCREYVGTDGHTYVTGDSSTTALSGVRVFVIPAE